MLLYPQSPFRFTLNVGLVAGLLLLVAPSPLALAQGAGVFGRVRDAATGEAIVGAHVSVEALERAALSDSTGRFHLAPLSPGPHVLVVQRIGYATARVPITVPARGLLHRDVELATTALGIPGLIVTADPMARARKELGTASVIDREAIAHQTAASLAGVLELIPGVELKAPGLAGIQQLALRAVPTSSVSGVVVGGPSPADLASFGTLIILDGVPLSNNANLQTTGPRGEQRVPSSAGGGIDLRRIPGSTIERVEVIRGVPSARYGDLTQGVIVVDTRAGAFAPEARALWDPASAAASLVGGWGMGETQALSAVVDATRTRLAPGWRRDQAYRFSVQLAHRAGVRQSVASTGDASLGELSPSVRRPNSLDSRFDFYQVYEDSPEDREVQPGRASWNRERGFRISERLHANVAAFPIELILSLENQRQRSMLQNMQGRPALPFTNRREEGRAIGRYIVGQYLSRLHLDGNVWNVYTRLESERAAGWFGADHQLRFGAELRREWNSGPGYQFAIEFPPQTSFNGVQGFDRPRPFDDLAPVATSALYVDQRMVQVLPGALALDIQAGARVDILHDGSSWASGARDAVIQPRVNAQLAPLPWLRLRAGFGRTTKQPALSALYPAPQYFDLVNVNWFTSDPAERLAVLTTFIRDLTNPDVGFSRGKKAEIGFELATADGDASFSAVAFRDQTLGGVGIRQRPSFLVRDRYELSDSTFGTGRPPTIIEPPARADTVPILLDIPANNLTLKTSGYEITARVPELRPIRTRVEAQLALVRTQLFKEGFDFGVRFSDFQMDERIPRAPFWEDVTHTGVRGIATYRVLHHQPELGLVVSAAIQHFFHEERQNIAGIDTLAFAGYLTRDGRLVPVALEERGRPEYADLRQIRTNTSVQPTIVQPDWLMSVQASLRLPLDGRLSFYAFNALDRKGRLGDAERSSRLLPAARFGLEATLPLPAVQRGLRSVGLATEGRR